MLLCQEPLKGLNLRMARSSSWAEGEDTFIIQPRCPRAKSQHSESQSQPSAPPPHCSTLAVLTNLSNLVVLRGKPESAGGEVGGRGWQAISLSQDSCGYGYVLSNLQALHSDLPRHGDVGAVAGEARPGS